MKTLTIIAFLVSFWALSAQEYTANTVGSDGGRYAIGQISQSRKDQYLIDTESGRVWQIVLREDGTMALQSVPYLLIDGSQSFEPMSSTDETQIYLKTLEKLRQEHPNSTPPGADLGDSEPATHRPQ